MPLLRRLRRVVHQVPRELLPPCGGRDRRAAAGLAALTRFKNGFVPDCGDWCGRRVHAVEALHGEALRLWNGVPLPSRCCRLARQPSDVGIGRTTSVSPERDGLPPRGRQGRAASVGSSRAPFASFGDDPLSRTFVSAIARVRERENSAPSDRFAAIRARVSRGAAEAVGLQPPGSCASVGADGVSTRGVGAISGARRRASGAGAGGADDSRGGVESTPPRTSTEAVPVLARE